MPRGSATPGHDFTYTCSECGRVKERDHFIRPPKSGTRSGVACPLLDVCYTCDLVKGRHSGDGVPPYYLVIAAIERRTGECYRSWMNTEDPRNDELVERMRALAGIDPLGNPKWKGHAKKRRPVQPSTQ
jgi:hypothetical protein